MTGTSTIAQVNARSPRTSIKTVSTGSAVYGIFTVKMSATYATGGDTCDLSAMSVANGKQPTAVFVQPTLGYLADYDKTNKKMIAYRQSAATSALTEPNGVDISAVTFTILAFW